MFWARAAALDPVLRLARANASRLTLRKCAPPGHLTYPRTQPPHVHTWNTPRALKSTDVAYSHVFGSHRGASLTAMWSTQSTALSTQTRHTEDRTDGDKGEEKNLKEAFATTSSPEKVPEHTEPEDHKPNQTQQLKKVFKEYGAVGVCFHIGISLMSLGMFYVLLSSGIDMTALLCKLGFSEAVVRSKMAAGTSTFVLAYAIHKLFAPVRISITLVSVPFIVRYFRKTGLFKPPTPAP